LVIIGVLFAAFLAFLNLKQEKKEQKKEITPIVEAAAKMQLPVVPLPMLVPEANPSAHQQIGVEVMPKAISTPVQAITSTQGLAPTDKEALTSGDLTRTLSFISYCNLRENLDFGSYEIDWRTYRDYRRSVAKSPEPK